VRERVWDTCWDQREREREWESELVRTAKSNLAGTVYLFGRTAMACIGPFCDWRCGIDYNYFWLGEQVENADPSLGLLTVLVETHLSFSIEQFIVCGIASWHGGLLFVGEWS
jgi:hypothetical protein